LILKIEAVILQDVELSSTYAPYNQKVLPFIVSAVSTSNPAVNVRM
jgi:hypothetical protein